MRKIKCDICQKCIQVRKDGRLVIHWPLGVKPYSGPICKGSGKKV